MSLISVKLAVVLVVLQLVPTFSLVNNNGWIPLTKDEALRNLDSEYNERSFTDQHFTDTTDDQTDELKILKKGVIKMVLPQKRLMILPNPIKIDTISNPLLKNNHHKCDNKNCKSFKTEETITDESDDVDKPDEADEKYNVSQELTVEISKRKPKHIPAVDLTKYSKNDPVRDIQIEKLGFTNWEENSKAMKGNQGIYQVTENISEVNEYEADDERSGYNYKRPGPKANITKIPSITNRFIETLSKYNIKLEDDLPNYTLSRQTKGPRSNFMFIPVPLNIPTRFNSFDHFSVDPLLAVFLSNYGYYLPGSYGIKNKYKNLYGYLASNNIHNNKPFGAYKIYSDTDSSN